jgi:hypothetical protein
MGRARRFKLQGLTILTEGTRLEFRPRHRLPNIFSDSLQSYLENTAIIHKLTQSSGIPVTINSDLEDHWFESRLGHGYPGWGFPWFTSVFSSKCWDSTWIKLRPLGRVMDQAVSRWLPTAAARVQTRVYSYGICGGQSGAGAGFLRVLRVPLPIFIPQISPQSPSPIIWGWYNRPVKWPHTKSPNPLIKKTTMSSFRIPCSSSFIFSYLQHNQNFFGGVKEVRTMRS